MTATRIDDRAGIAEEARFFGEAEELLYGCLHRPLGRVLGGVVICCSIHAELQESYRSEVLLARALARRGLAVQRFHYRGAGHSDGDPAQMTFERMRADALAAVARLRDDAGVSRPALLGARLGGLVAAAAARDLDGALVALWEPVQDPARYFREAVRARLIHRLRTGEAGGPGGELGGASVVDILGYPVHRALYDSACARTLAGELSDRPRPVLLVQLSRSRDLRPDHRRLIDALGAAGLQVEVRIVAEQPGWWFARGTAHSLGPAGAATMGWLVDRLTEAAA
jgi:acetyl esterase/lipase